VPIGPHAPVPDPGIQQPACQSVRKEDGTGQISMFSRVIMVVAHIFRKYRAWEKHIF